MIKQKALIDRENQLRRLEEQTYEFRKFGRNQQNGDGDKPIIDKSTETTPIRPPSSIAEMERIRLLELLTVVNRRLEEARRESIESDTLLRKEKFKCAKLETKIARLELERVGSYKSIRGNSKTTEAFNESEIAVSM